MANYFDVQILEDGTDNVVAKIVLVNDTSDSSQVLVLDPSALFQGILPTDRLSVSEIQYAVQDGWVVSLYWDATTPKVIVELAGRGEFYTGLNYGGLQDDAGAGATGKITLSTLGWSGTKVATLILHCTKQWSGATVSLGDILLQENGDAILQEDGSYILL